MIEFKKPSQFPRGSLYYQLVDAYSFNNECKKAWDTSWQEYDNYFYDNLKKIVVTTNELFVPAQKNYERVVFEKIGERDNKKTPFSGKYIDYEIIIKN